MLMNCDPRALMEASKCYACIPNGTSGAVISYLLCQWAQGESPEPPSGCGTPSDVIVITGAGSGEANGTYIHNESFPSIWNSITDPQARISLFAGIATIEYGLAAHQLYKTPIADFPCTWTTDLDGVDPAPTGSYSTAVAFAWIPTSETATWTDMNGVHVGDLATFNATAHIASVSILTFGATGLLSGIIGLHFLPALSSLDVNTNALTSLDCHACTSLLVLNCSTNQLGNLDITGDFAITTLDFSNNPAVVIIGP